MGLLKPKQLDLVGLSASLVQLINENSAYKAQWAAILNNTFATAVFSTANGNITSGQSNFVVSYVPVPTEIFVYRNGIKQILDAEYTTTIGSGSFTITFNEPVGASPGGLFSETIEINYH